MKYEENKLNILDTEKKTLTFKSPVQFDKRNYSYIFFFIFCKFKFFASCMIGFQ